MFSKAARPSAGQLSYQLYARTIHPELFEICASEILILERYSLVTRICESGHVVELRHDGDVVTEVHTDGETELPKSGRVLSVGLKQCHDMTAEPHPGISIQASTQTEIVEPEVFERLSEEFLSDIPRATVAFEFGSRNRLRPDAVSLIFTDCAHNSIVVHAFHTFPDDWTIIRTQSLYEF